MIISKLSYRFGLISLVVFVLLTIIALPICTTQYDWNLETYYDFHFTRFIRIEFVLAIICLVIFYVHAADQKEILIDGTKITVRKLLSTKKIEFDFSEINGFQWYHSVSSAPRGQAKTRNKNLLITFTDESELLISDYDYSNYEDLKEILFVYCKRRGLIKETSGQLRRRRRMMGK